jgi:hypothetical protein
MFILLQTRLFQNNIFICTYDRHSFPKNMLDSTPMPGFSIKVKTYNALADLRFLTGLLVCMNYLLVCILAEKKTLLLSPWWSAGLHDLAFHKG